MKARKLILALVLSRAFSLFAANVLHYEYGWSNTYVSTSDIAINAREVKTGVAVWTTSVSTGEVLSKIKLELYSEANTLISTGESDENGWCFLKSKFNESHVVVASREDGKDTTSMILNWRNTVQEDYSSSRREHYLEEGEFAAFLWTDRALYRHDEPIFFKAIVRDKNTEAPAPTAFRLRLIDPTGVVRKERSVKSDETGVIIEEEKGIAADLPDGRWTYELRSSAKQAALLGKRSFSVEEFAPPQVRVTIETDEIMKTPDYRFKVKAEHLFGGPAKDLRTKAIVIFETLSSKRASRVLELGEPLLDERGEVEFAIPEIREWLKNVASGRLTISASVIEDGGRAATSRKEVVIDNPSFEKSDSEETARLAEKKPKGMTVKTLEPYYFVGDAPKIEIDAPFAGKALVTIMRDDIVYAEVISVTEGVNEFTLRRAEKGWAPNVEARVCLVKAGDAAKRGFAARAYATEVIGIRDEERRFAIDVKGEYAEKQVIAALEGPKNTKLVVSLVDEGIHLLGGEKPPEPFAFFSKPRQAAMNFAYDIYHNLRPLSKTGGDIQAELFGRISPVPTRRFKPLAKWRIVETDENGKAEVRFDVEEFVGEVRLTVLGATKTAVGSISTQVKCAPKLVIQPDAPRFVAPNDKFSLSFPLKNRASEKGLVRYSVAVEGETILEGEKELESGEDVLIAREIAAIDHPGEMELRFKAEGLGETHLSTIHLPVRPAIAWHVEAGVRRIGLAESFSLPESAPFERYTYKEIDPGTSEIAGALDFLASYPYGCLEQTSAKILPLVGSKEYEEYVIAGVRRVESMVDWNGFYMWPDCDYPPWDKEVAIFASHFLFEAERAGIKLSALKRGMVMAYLSEYSRSSSLDEASYANMVLALAYRADRGRMNSLYNLKDERSLFARASLALAFAEVDDWEKANELMNRSSLAPDSVKDAAFALAALLSSGKGDERAHQLAAYLTSKRDKSRYSWGTTGENALAIWALKKYYKLYPIEGEGDKFIAWRKFTLKKPEELQNRADTLSIKKRYLNQDGAEYDLENAKVGDYVIVELTLSSDKSRNFNDLVIEDLFPAAFEPIIESDERIESWVMRYDTRDDRELVFSKKFYLTANEEVKFRYALRVVSKGDYIVPACSVEAMYDGAVGARDLPRRVVVRD